MISSFVTKPVDFVSASLEPGSAKALPAVFGSTAVPLTTPFVPASLFASKAAEPAPDVTKAYSPDSLLAAIGGGGGSGNSSGGVGSVFFCAPAPDIATVLRPTQKRMSTVVTLKASLAGCADFINLIADNLDKSKYPKHIDHLKILAKQYGAIEKVNLTPAAKVTIAGAAQRLRKTVVAILIRIKPEDCETLKKILASQETAKKITFPPFLKDIMTVVEYQKQLNEANQKQMFHEAASTVDRLIELWRRSQEAELLPLIVDWAKTLPRTEDKKEQYDRDRRYRHIFSVCVSISHDSYVTLIQQSPNLLPLYTRIYKIEDVIGGYLNEENTKAWQFLMPKKTAQPTAAELEIATKDLAAIKSLWQQKKVVGALELAKKHMFDVDPTTKALKFPDLCFEFFEQLLALPKEQLAQLDTNSKNVPPAAHSEKDEKTSKATLAVAVKFPDPEEEEKKLSKPLMDIVEFMITFLPDGDRKKALLAQAKENDLFRPVSSTLCGAQLAISHRPLNLLKLAKIFIKKDEIKLAFEVVAQINQEQSPFVILGFIFAILEREPQLTNEQKTVIETMIHKLPKVLKYFLVMQNKAEHNLLLAPLEKEFDLNAFKQEAEKEISLYVTQDKIISFFMKGGLKEDVLDKVFLFYSKMSRNERGDFLSNKIWKKQVNHAVLNHLLNFHVAANSTEKDPWDRVNTNDWHHLVDNVKTWKLHPYFKHQLVQLTKTSDATVSAELEKEIDEKERKQLATLDEDYRQMRTVSQRNPLLTAEDFREANVSDLYLSAYYIFLSDIRGQSNTDFRNSGVAGWMSQYLKWALQAWRTLGFGIQLRSNLNQ